MKAFVSAVILAFVGAFAQLGAQQPQVSSAVSTVRQLYADFACEAVIEEPGCDRRHELIDQPQAVLVRPRA